MSERVLWEGFLSGGAAGEDEGFELDVTSLAVSSMLPKREVSLPGGAAGEDEGFELGVTSLAVSLVLPRKEVILSGSTADIEGVILHWVRGAFLSALLASWEVTDGRRREGEGGRGIPHSTPTLTTTVRPIKKLTNRLRWEFGKSAST